MVILMAIVYYSKRIQIIINKEKKEMGQSPGETRHKLSDVFSSAFTWECAKVSQQWHVTTHVKYCQPEKLIQMLAFRVFTWGLHVDMLEKQWQPTPVLLPGKFHGQRSLVGRSPWGLKELDTTERLHFHFSLSCIGEGNGNPLQCSCLENPRMAKPGGLLSMGLHRVGHDWSDLAAAAACRHVMPYKAECYKGSEIISQGSTQGLVLKTVFSLECAGFEQPRSVEGNHSWPAIQFSSVTQSCLTLCDPKGCSTSGLPVHRQLLEFTQTHVLWVGDAIQLSHPLLSLSPPAFNLSQHQGLFQWVSSSNQMAKVLEFQLQHQSFQWIFKTDLL